MAAILVAMTTNFLFNNLVTFRERADFDALLTRARERGLPFFAEPFVRMAGEPAEHETFFLIDPSNNLLEFKHYRDPGCML